MTLEEEGMDSAGPGLVLEFSQARCGSMASEEGDELDRVGLEFGPLGRESGVSTSAIFL